MQIRQAGWEDVEQLAGLRAVWREQALSEDFVATFRAWFSHEAPTRWWWMAVDEGEAVGMVNVKIFERMPSPERPASRWGYLANRGS
jgi:hypothetical protein